MSRKESIPIAVRNATWNKYIGRGLAEGECYVGCGNKIHFSDYECGHIQAEAEGGRVHLDNLRPICSKCNKSIGTRNMKDFMDYYGLICPYPNFGSESGTNLSNSSELINLIDFTEQELTNNLTNNLTINDEYDLPDFNNDNNNLIIPPPLPPKEKESNKQQFKYINDFKRLYEKLSDNEKNICLFELNTNNTEYEYKEKIRNVNFNDQKLQKQNIEILNQFTKSILFELASLVQVSFNTKTKKEQLIYQIFNTLRELKLKLYPETTISTLSEINQKKLQRLDEDHQKYLLDLDSGLNWQNIIDKVDNKEINEKVYKILNRFIKQELVEICEDLKLEASSTELKKDLINKILFSNTRLTKNIIKENYDQFTSHELTQIKSIYNEFSLTKDNNWKELINKLFNDIELVNQILYKLNSDTISIINQEQNININNIQILLKNITDNKIKR